MLKQLMGFAAVLTVIAPAYAQESTFGSGVMASKCSRLVGGMGDSVSVGQNPLAFAMLSWAEGYITATNMSLVKDGEAGFDLNSLTGAEIWASLYGYCKRNPEEVAIGGVIETMAKLKRRK